MGPRRRRTSTSSAPASIRWRRPGKLGALLAQFPASFKNEPDSRGYLEWLLERFRDYPSPSSCAIGAGAISRTTRCSCSTRSAPRWAQIDEPKFRFSIRQNLLPNVRTFYYLRLHGRNAAQWWSHDKSEDRYNYLYSAEELAAVRRGGEGGVARSQEGLSLREQSLLGEVGGQRGDPEARARTAAAGRIPAGVRRSLSGPERPRQGFAAPSFTYAFLSMSATWILSTTSMPLMTWPNTVYFAVELRGGFVQDVELAVGGLRVGAGVRHRRPRRARAAASS